MPFALIALHAILAGLGFVITLNFYLRGAAKAQITAVLAVLLLLTLVAVFASYGWVAGIVALPLAYLYAALTAPLARKAAWRVLGYRTSAESGGEFADLHALQAGKLPFDQYFEQVERRRHREGIELRRLIAQPAVQETLRSVSGTDDDVAELVRILSLTGVGRELALRSIVHPDVLADLLMMHREGKEAVDLAARVMEL